MSSNVLKSGAKGFFFHTIRKYVLVLPYTSITRGNAFYQMEVKEARRTYMVVGYTKKIQEVCSQT
jgi:hypothetical protein